MKKLIVHVGPWLRVPGTIDGINVRENEIHLCYEPDKDVPKFLIDKLPPNVVIVPTEFQETSLKPNSVDRVYLHNVLNDKRGQNHAGILDKMRDVLKPGCKGVVGHTNTPAQMPFSELEGVAKIAGLKPRILIKDNGTGMPTERQKRIISTYLGDAVAIDQGFYLAVLTKPK